MCRKLWVGLCGLIIAGLWSVSANGFQPHRAIYDLSLSQSEDGSGITSVRGRLANEWTRECDGFLFNQRMVMDMGGPSGGRTLMDYHVSTWESLDGKTFRFSLKTKIDGEISEEYVGRARMPDGGKAGSAEFSKPKIFTLELPPGTLFPTAHSLAAIKAALEGEKLFVVNTFDGSDGDAVYNASLVLGKERQDTKELTEEFDTVAGQRAWPARLAFFKKDAAGSTPAVEMGFLLFANGVIAELVLDYSDFSVAGKLSQLEKIDEPNC